MMIRILPILLSAVLAAPLFAQLDAQVGLTVELGVAGMVRPPYTQIRVRVIRGSGEVLKGRVTVRLLEGGGGRPGGPPPGSSAHEFSRELHFAEGEREKGVDVLVPVVSTMMAGKAVFEREESAGRHIELGERDFITGLFGGQQPVVGFISPVRLAALREYARYDFWEIPKERSPRDWRALQCFDAIVLNEEDLDNEQYDALTGYVVAGGTLILSAHTQASFSSGTPGAELLGITTIPPVQVRPLSEQGALSRELPKLAKRADAMPAEGGAPLRYWPFAGARLHTARGPNAARPMISLTRCGAGRVALLHTDISQPPFASTEHRKPRAPCGHLLDLALQLCREQGMGRTPFDTLISEQTANAFDIAGARIPGHQVIVVVIVLYVIAAGVGMSLLARRLKRPQLYPLGLLVLAVVAVAAALGLGGAVKMMGERVQAARYIVSDANDTRQSVFTFGCAFAVSGEGYRFVTESGTALSPGRMAGGGIRGMPTDVLPMHGIATDKENQLELRQVARWQNIYFTQTAQRRAGGMALRTTPFAGGLGLENLGEHELRGCLVIVAGEVSGKPEDGLEWHYLPRIAAAGKQEARATIDKSTRLRGERELLERWEAGLGRGSIEYSALRRLLSLDGTALPVREDFMDAMQALERTGLLAYKSVAGGKEPVAGQYIVIGALPDNTLAPQTLGTPVDPRLIRQACVWCALGQFTGE